MTLIADDCNELTGHRKHAELTTADKYLDIQTLAASADQQN